MTSRKSLSQIAPRGAHIPLKALSLITCFVLILFAGFAAAQPSPIYGDQPNACQNLSLGSPTYGPDPTTGEYGGATNGFLPFPSDSAWNTNIYNANLDPNNAAIQAAWPVGRAIHQTFGASPSDGGIPYIVVDSTQTPLVPLYVTPCTTVGGCSKFTDNFNATTSDVVIAPYPPGDTVPSEGDFDDCTGWPDTNQGDSHTLVLDRATCFLYETYPTNRCQGQYTVDELILWDMTQNEQRPYGWISADAAGLAIFPGLLRYDEAASGVINHAIRWTIGITNPDANGGYYVLPATHTDAKGTGTLKDEMGERIRLKASVDISSYSAMNQTILTAMKQYGMILADDGSNFYFIGDTDPRWNDSDLGNLHGTNPIISADFEVVDWPVGATTMTPAYPGYDDGTVPTGAIPVINSFTVVGGSPNLTVSAGTPVTFNFSASGDSYDYIDNAGAVRLTGGSGSVTITPTKTQEYTFYSTNAFGRATSGPIYVTVPGTTVAAPIITPAGGSFAASSSLSVSLREPSAGAAPASSYSFYYTLTTGTTGTPAGTTPTTGSTLYNEKSISVSKSGGWAVLEAFAIVPYIGTSPVSTATFTFGSTSTPADTPLISPPSGTYNTPQPVVISDSTRGATPFFTTDGSTPTTASFANYVAESLPPTPPTLAFSNGVACYDCPPTALPIAVNGETIKAIAATFNSSTGAISKISAVSSATYTIITSTPTFSPAGGSYIGTQTVTLSDASPSATIYYTTNATTPTSGSTVYTGPLTIAATTTLEAIAEQPYAANSAVVPAIYTILIPAAMISPTSGSTLGASQAFTWSVGFGVSHYELWVGNTAVGSSNLYNSGSVTVTTETVNGLPSNGQAIYVRLFSLINGVWKSTDYTYTATGSPTLAQLISPPPGSVLPGGGGGGGSVDKPLISAGVAFTWTPGNVATHFELWLGSTGVGSSNLYNSGNVTVTTETVYGLPTNGETLYARLYSLIDGAWQSADYTYTSSGTAVPASMSTPTPGSTLGSTSQAFTWNPGNVATHFELWVGSTGVGSSNVYNSGNVTVTTETVTGLPSNGQPLYVRLYSLINGGWQSADYTYTASGAPIAASMSSPTGGSTLGSTSQAFTWNPGNTATHFELWVGSTGVGSSNLYNSGNVTVTTETVNGLPSNDSMVYVRLYSLINGAWQSADYTYTSSGTAVPASMTSPTPGSQFLSTSQAFVWSPGNNATHFELWLGSTGVGSSNLYNSGNVTVTTETVSGLPTNGETIYVRLYSLINGAWQSADYTYLAQ